MTRSFTEPLSMLLQVTAARSRLTPLAPMNAFEKSSGSSMLMVVSPTKPLS